MVVVQLARVYRHFNMVEKGKSGKLSTVVKMKKGAQKSDAVGQPSQAQKGGLVSDKSINESVGKLDFHPLLNVTCNFYILLVHSGYLFLYPGSFIEHNIVLVTVPGLLTLLGTWPVGLNWEFHGVLLKIGNL